MAPLYTRVLPSARNCCSSHKSLSQPSPEQVYVTPYPNVGDDMYQVSRNGGVHPLWGPNGRELFYATHRAVDGEQVTIMAAEIDYEPTVAPRVPYLKAVTA